MYSVQGVIFWIIGFCLKLVSFYQAVIGLFSIFKSKKIEQCAPKTRFAVLIAARNEERVIEGVIRSLAEQNYPKELFDIFVIPNNCTDNTAFVAEKAGARLLECDQPVKNKGDALHLAFGKLLDLRYDAFCVFDADNMVHRDFLARMNDAFAKGARVAKGKQRALNPYDTWVSGCYDIYFDIFNFFYNRARSRLGLSAKMVGTGFAVSSSLLKELGGWNTGAMTEDVEFSAQCALAGERIVYVPEAVTYDEEPASFRQSVTQRRRWCSGIVETGKKYALRLLRGLNRKNWKLSLDFLILVLAPAVQVVSAIPTVWTFVSFIINANYIHALFYIAASYLGAAAAGAFIAFVLGKRKAGSLKAVLMFPFFLISWFPLQAAALFRKTSEWKPIVHTRSNEQSVEL